MAKRTSIQAEKSTMDAVVQVLEEADVEYVFGVPGGYMMKLYDSLANSSIKPILTRHEQIASIMAEVYGRLTGKPGIFTSQGAWAVSNGLMGAVEAIQGSSPMVMLTDMTDNAPYSHHGSYQTGTGEYGSYDVKKAVEAATKYSTVVHMPEQAVQSVQLALKHALDGNPGPSAVVFHSSAINGTVKPNGSPVIYHTKHYLLDQTQTPHRDELMKALHTLKEAKNPFIIAGNGVKVSNAFQELENLAELLGAPVGTTTMGKSALRETHPQSVGVIGNWGTPVGNKILSEADVLLVVGSKLAPTDTCNHHRQLIDPQRQTIIQIDIESKHASWTFPVDQAIIGDAKRVLREMIRLLENEIEIDRNKLEKRIERIAQLKEDLEYIFVDESYADARPIKPQRALKEIYEAIDENTMITLDAGENRVYTIRHFKSKVSGSVILPGSAGGMGYAIPSALAAKLVYPDKNVLAIAGDGGFSMTMNGLITAVEHDLPIVTVIFNNSSLGWVKNAQGKKKVASEFMDIDYGKIGAAMGCLGYTIDDPNDIKGALTEAFHSNKPAVLDIKTTDEESYHKVMSELATSLE